MKGKPETAKNPAVPAALPERLYGLRFHDLRHTYVSMCVAQGVALSVIGDQVGHSAMSMTESYAYLYDEVRDRTADALDAMWTGDAPAAPRLRAVE